MADPAKFEREAARWRWELEARKAAEREAHTSFPFYACALESRDCTEDVCLFVFKCRDYVKRCWYLRVTVRRYAKLVVTASATRLPEEECQHIRM